MTFDTTISLDVIVALLVIFGSAWHLDGKIKDFRREFDRANSRNFALN